MKKFDVAIIGCSGFIATRLIDELLESGKTILAFGPERPSQNQLNLHYVYYDVLNRDRPGSGDKIFAQTVIYNAVIKGRFEKDTDNWVKQGRVSAPGFEALFSGLNLVADRLITLGSSEEYGARDTDLEIDEFDETHPLSSYGYWKTRLYQNARSWASKNGKEFVHLRPFVIFGEGQDHNMFLGSIIPALLKGMEYNMTRGEQWRNFIHIDVICEFMKVLIGQDRFKHSIVNLGSRVYLKIVEVAKLVHSSINKGSLNIGAIPYRNFEVWHQKPGLKRMDEIAPNLKYNSFEDDLGRLIKYYQGSR